MHALIDNEPRTPRIIDVVPSHWRWLLIDDIDDPTLTVESLGYDPYNTADDLYEWRDIGRRS